LIEDKAALALELAAPARTALDYLGQAVLSGFFRAVPVSTGARPLLTSD